MNQNNIEASKTEIEDLRALIHKKIYQVDILSMLSETINLQIKDGLEHDADSILEMIDSWRKTHRKSVRRLKGNDR